MTVLYLICLGIKKISNNFGRRKNDPAKDRKALETYVSLRGYKQGGNGSNQYKQKDHNGLFAKATLDEIAKELNMSTTNLKRALRNLLHDVNVDEDAEDDIGVNLCMSPFEEEHMGSEHVFYRLKKIGRDVENICKYFNKKKLKINRKYIRIFSVPTETECTISYMIKTNDHGITYIFSDLYFPFLNRRENNIEKFD